MSTIERLQTGLENVGASDESLVGTMLRPPWLFLLPLLLLLVFMFVGPLLSIVLMSVQPGNSIQLVPTTWTLANYEEIIAGIVSGEGVYGQVMVNTILISLTTTVVTLVFSYPAAYALARKIERFKLLFLLALIVPLFTSVNIRVFGWVLFLVQKGVLQSFLGLFGITTPSLLYQRWTIILGTSYVYMPFMLFPIYLSLLTIEDQLFEAARDLGTSRLKLFKDIVLPMSWPGIVIGSLFVFVLSLGAEVEALLLGGGSIYTAANNISYSFGYSQNWPLGSAQAMGLLIVTLVSGVIILRTIDLQEIAKRGD
ncbi:ABC transporter permease [Halorarius litoreus]|uniref:ABC transporter permease n=1 Tax=Halorarius litoreus TaxID=2962676 RepID=UPI0020CCAA26|nr:ABC transporter permease [Halorarius litoreus]